MMPVTFLPESLRNRELTEDLRIKSWFYQAECAYNLKNYIEAEDFYKKVVKTTDKGKFYEKSLYGLGWCEMEKQEYLLAIESFRKLVEINPNGVAAAEAQFTIGDAFYAFGEIRGRRRRL